jgi:hypothetical protein
LAADGGGEYDTQQAGETGEERAKADVTGEQGSAPRGRSPAQNR